ncbi:MAG: alpha-amylase family glycosyl hydrolase [Thermaurantimonas sp.]|uniref:alpha-amylase family glycosyl hydrolase n=1 Tax=Thermaurantimonas sp. TaxID=2681568 RepID=UPI00391AE310
MTPGIQRISAIFSVFGLFFLISCGRNTDGFSANDDIRYLYPFTPIRLSPDTTVFYLDDYFPDEQVDSFRFPDPLQVVNTNESKVFKLVGNASAAIDVATFYTSSGKFEIPVYRSEKVRYTYTLPASINVKQSVAIKGTFNSWNTLANPFELKDGVYQTTILADPGTYEYVLVVDGREMTDPENPQTVSNGMGGFNSLLTIESGKTENCGYVEAVSYQEGMLRIKGISQGQRVIAFFNNQKLSDNFIHINPEHVDIVFPLASVRFPRSWLRVFSFSDGCRNNEILIPLAEGRPVSSYSQLTRNDWHATIWYFLMVDRFYNGNPANDQKVVDPEILPIANYFGGDLEGIRQKVAEGYFDSLGVNAIWLSPITQNPSGAWGLWDKGGVKTKFSGYHGYWPISNVRVDHRFGTAEELNALLATGKKKGYRFVLDYVANHVHQEHPVYQKNPDWATSLYLPDGSLNTERWDDHRLTTWFDVFMPTLDLTRPEIVEPMTDSALVWVRDFGFDGFRHDATKHIDELFWRTLTRKIKQLDRVRHNGDRIYQIGETYGSPELIASYISSGMLDAQFDFNLYDAAIRYFAIGSEADLDKLLTTIQTSLKTYGMHHLMGHITGNQDRPRFISLASGDVRFDEDTKLAGYTRQIGKPHSDAYLKLQMLTAFNIVLPGIPILYYGDEIGMPGANDPDNRRMMKFTNWDSDEKSTFVITRRLIALRKHQLPLLYGTTRVYVDGGLLVVERNYLGKRIRAFFNNTSSPRPMPDGKLLLTNSADGTLSPYTFAIAEV